MGSKSYLLSPPSDLAACLFAAVVRDTRGTDLSDLDRYNFFPASPLVSVTYLVEGEIRMSPDGGGVEAARLAKPLLRTSVIPPQPMPTVSWCAGPVLAITLGVYPDAWRKLAVSVDLAGSLATAFGGGEDLEAGWSRFCASLSPVWDAARDGASFPGLGGPRLSDWARGVVARAAMSGPGRGVRSLERRLKRWSGQTRGALSFYAAIEDLHRLSTEGKDRPLAELALEAGYADQSHMGRAVRRATGFSPAQLNQSIRTKEAFWYYRLAGEQL